MTLILVKKTCGNCHWRTGDYCTHFGGVDPDALACRLHREKEFEE